MDDGWKFARFVAFGVLFLLLSLVFLGLTALKESDLFWSNAGGYSIGFRDFVLKMYYPLTILFLLFQSTTTLGFFVLCWGVRRSDGLMGLVALVPSWILSIAGITLLLANNVLNLLNGRSLHWDGP
jgi:hypothetical protein